MTDKDIEQAILKCLNGERLTRQDAALLTSFIEFRRDQLQLQCSMLQKIIDNLGMYQDENVIEELLYCASEAASNIDLKYLYDVQPLVDLIDKLPRNGSTAAAIHIISIAGCIEHMSLLERLEKSESFEVRRAAREGAIDLVAFSKHRELATNKSTDSPQLTSETHPT